MPPATLVRPWYRTPAPLTALLALVLALLLAFGLLGARGIWDPDEGRYTNVALHMLHSGDWVHPHRSETVEHWTKPPLAYWTIAASAGTFGVHAWSLRLPAALAYLLSVLLAWLIARRLLPGSEALAATVYATMLFPASASQFITTDYVLAACEALALWGFVEARFGQGQRSRGWIALMWLGFALAFMTKGPPGLLALLAVVAYTVWMPGERLRDMFRVSGIALFALLALPWYLIVINSTPGLLDYFLGREMVGRIASDGQHRNGQWYGWLMVYGPTLVLGSLPWTPALWRWLKTLPATLRGWWRAPGTRREQAPLLLLTLWLLLPLIVFCVAKSRLPLYVLPLFTPLALLAARQWRLEGRGMPRARWLLVWVAFLLLLRIGAAYWPTHKNAGEWADELRARSSAPVHRVVFVNDMARYGLHAELGAQVEKVSLEPLPWPQSRFGREYDMDLAQALSRNESGVLWISKQALWPQVQSALTAQGYAAQVLGKPHRGRIVFQVNRAKQTAAPGSLPAPSDGNPR